MYMAIWVQVQLSHRDQCGISVWFVTAEIQLIRTLVASGWLSMIIKVPWKWHINIKEALLVVPWRTAAWERHLSAEASRCSSTFHHFQAESWGRYELDPRSIIESIIGQGIILLYWFVGFSWLQFLHVTSVYTVLCEIIFQCQLQSFLLFEAWWLPVPECQMKWKQSFFLLYKYEYKYVRIS